MRKTMTQAIREYLQEPNHKKEFETWYRNRYGKQYEWRTIKDDSMAHIQH